MTAENAARRRFVAASARRFNEAAADDRGKLTASVAASAATTRLQ